MRRDKDHMQKGTIVIIDPAIQRIGSHHFTSLELLQSTFCDYQTKFYVNIRSSPDITDQLDDVCFWFAADSDRPTSQRRKKSANPFYWQVSQTIRKLSGKPADIVDGHCYRDQLTAIFERHESSDHLIFPTTKIDTLVSLLAVLKHTDLENIPYLHLRFIEFAAKPDKILAKSAYRKLSNLIRSCPRIRVYTETLTLRDYLTRHFGIHEIGRAILQPAKSEVKADGTVVTNHQQIRIGYVGGTRKDKGCRRIAPIVDMVTSKIAEGPLAEKIQFVVQVSDDKNGRKLRKQLLRIPNLMSTQLMLVSEPLGLAEFSSLISSCDVHLFPYTDEKFRTLNSSGILIDAVTNAVPVICAPIATLSEFVTDDMGIIADSDEGFADAIIALIGDLDRYKANAKRAAWNLKQISQENDLINYVKDRLQA
jgi:hypothetical protein